VDTPENYDPAQSGCFHPPGSKYVFWSNLCVGYSLQRDASKYATLDQATQLAAQAFQAWSQVKCADGRAPSIFAQNNGPAECTAVQYNANQRNQHLIVFRDEAWPHTDQSNTLGYTRLRVGLETGRIYDADMEINSSDYVLVVDRAPIGNEFDLASIMTHEAGHFLGLAHSADPNAIMFTHYHVGSTVPTQDDIDGICTMYPPDGTRKTSDGPLVGASCDAAPENGFGSACGDPDAGPTTTVDMPVHHSACSIGPPGIGRGGGWWLLPAAGLVGCILGRRRARE
jgi:hypothetical protein